MSTSFPIRAALLAVAAASVAACTATPPADSSELLSALPEESVGAVLVGPSQFPFDSDVDTMLLIPFDEHGRKLGEVQGGAVLNGQLQTLGRQIVFPTAKSLIEFGPDGRRDIDIDEQVVEAIVESPDAEDGIIWFNSGKVGNTYSTNYWLTNPSLPSPSSGTLPGMTVSSAFCEGIAYAVVEDQSQLSWDGPLTNWLYRVDPKGGAEIIGEWKFPASKRPVSRRAVCSDDGLSMAALYTDREGSGNPDMSPLLKIEINISDASLTEYELLGPGEGWRVPTKAVGALNGRMYWANTAGQIYSTAIQGSDPAHLEYEIRTDSLHDKILISGKNVYLLVHSSESKLVTYDLASGKNENSEIDLSWLSSVAGSETESGQSTRAVTDLTLF